MRQEDFLQIFKTGFHKLKLKRIVRYGEGKNPHGRKYRKCLGLFEFMPPEQVWMDGVEFDYVFLHRLLEKFSGELSNCVTHRFTRKMLEDGKVKRRVTDTYVFDIVPKNVVEFRFYPESRTMRVVAKGYMIEK